MSSTTPLAESTALATLPRTGDLDQWTDAQRGLAEFVGFTTKMDGVLVVAPRGVREAYLIALERTQLDALARQIYLAYIGGKWLIIVSIDGFRLIAQRSREYRGQDAPEWTDGVDQIVPVIVDGSPVVVEGAVLTQNIGPRWVDVWTADAPPAACRVGVHRRGFKKPVVGIATWKAYGKSGPKAGQWDKNGPHMLSIRAEAQGLRKAFPLELSGLYTVEEFDRDQNENEVPTRDWLGELAETNLLGVGILYEELRTSTEWNPKLDAAFRARKGQLAMEAEEASSTVIVQETDDAQ